jgi:hypothetical protein
MRYPPCFAFGPDSIMSFPTLSRRLALLAFCLIAILPFASRIHFVPLPQWFGEMNVVWLMLISALFLLPSGMLFERVPAPVGGVCCWPCSGPFSHSWYMPCFQE